MFKSGSKHFPLILVIIVSFAFVGFALAQDAGVSIQAEASVTPPPGPGAQIRPLDLARQKAMELKQNAANANGQLRVEAGVELRHASTGPENRPDMKGRAASSTGPMQKIRGAIHQHAGIIKQRFGLAIRHFEQFIGRIETRIDKMAAAGVDTTAIEAQLEAAKTAQVSAKADIQAVSDYIESVDENADRTQVRTQLQALVETANESIKEAHLELQKTVRALVASAKERPETDASASVEAEIGTAVNE